MSLSKKTQLKERRRKRVRARVVGSPDCPRLSVGRSLRGMYVQLIDDSIGKTLLSVNSKKDATGDAGGRSGKVATAYQLGMSIANKAKSANISKVVFDRAGNLYHGRVKAVADGARDGGLVF